MKSIFLSILLLASSAHLHAMFQGEQQRVQKQVAEIVKTADEVNEYYSDFIDTVRFDTKSNRLGRRQAIGDMETIETNLENQARDLQNSLKTMQELQKKAASLLKALKSEWIDEKKELEKDWEKRMALKRKADESD